MATEHSKWRTNIGRVGLFGASAGLVLGLIEAACLRLPDMPLALQKPHVPLSFWLFAPLLGALVFGLLGLLAGALATLPRTRFLGMVIIAGLAGMAGGYFGLVFQYFPSGRAWFVFLREIIPPNLVFALVFGGTLAILWATRRSGSPLGALAHVPLRFWSGTVLGAIGVLAIALEISSPYHHLLASAANATARPPSPNIVLIVWDTARGDHFSSNGYLRNTTPNADQFAQRGVLFENAISASNWTLPGMASIFTGLLPHQHGASADTTLGNGPRTLAEILRVAGYETAGFNANPYFGVSACGLGRGFETYIDSASSLGYNLNATRIGHDFVEPYSEEWFHRSCFYQFNARQLNEQIYGWFGHRSNRPFFLFVNYNDAHDPYEVPSPYDHVYGRISEEAKLLLPQAKLGRVELPVGERESVINAYDNSLRYIDSQMGKLLQFLERSPQWSNTYVIITADHGEAFGEHHTYTHGWDLHREVLHVPLIIAGPGIPQGIRVSQVARTRQIFSTVLDWAGMHGPILRRSSLSRLWDNVGAANRPEYPAVSEVIEAAPPSAPQGTISITTPEWHYIYCAGYHRSQLYHWPTDPAEQSNVSELPENQATVLLLQNTLRAIVEASYRPWRDTRYLQALSGPDFSPDDEARAPARPMPGDPLLPPGPGAAQALFPQNAETHRTKVRMPDRDMLESLPYDAR